MSVSSSKRFAINVHPHEVIIGTTTLLLEPEIEGAVFADAYAELKAGQAKLKAAGDEIDGEHLKAVNAAMRTFIRSFLLEESTTVFDDLRIPDRILVKLLEHVAELYGGGSQGNGDGGSSGAS